MLYLTRKIGESIMIGDDTEVVVMAIKGKSVKLGFTFPPQVSVLRREVYDRIKAENRAAAESGMKVADIFLNRPKNDTSAPSGESTDDDNTR